MTANSDLSTQVHVFTSAAINYLPKVRMLFNSLRKHHPDWILHLALADILPSNLDIGKEPIDHITTIESLNIYQWRGWAFCHTITELATAIKPWMLERLLEQSGDGGKVIYLDPDIVVFSPLTDIIAALDESSIVLTPHQTQPESTLAAVIDNEICSLKHGIYNLGFLAVSNTPIGRAFARWWAERTYYFCRDEIPNGLFTDQRWIDLVPAFFPEVAIMRTTRHNVATWNITTRNMSFDQDGNYLVDNQPLGFYHFTGFDSGAHLIMAAKNGSGNNAINRLVSWYTDQIKPLANDPLTNKSWAFSTFESGDLITKYQRIVYRSRRDLQLTFPNPFDIDGFETWWHIRAKSEYPDLFRNESKDSALQKIVTPITPGFLGSSASLSGGLNKAAQLLIRALTDQETGYQISKRSWEVLKQEGINGIISRLS